MKNIELKKIHIENFRGLKDFAADFGTKKTVVCGDNATGKSTIFAAFTWCLFGKDEQNRKDFEIKPCVNGKSVRVDTAVTITIKTDTGSHELKRTYKENWVKHKGEATETFTGNVTECFWDEAPVSVTEYGRRVSELVNEDVFKMLTNPYYFTSLDYKKQRQALFLMVPTSSDDELAKNNADFAALLDELSGKSLSDFKAEINRALRSLRQQHAGIQPRIEEVMHQRPELDANEDAVLAERAALKASISELQTALQSLSEKENEKASELADLGKRKLAAANRANELVNNAQMVENARVRELNAVNYELQTELAKAEQALNNANKEVDAAERKQRQTAMDLENAKQELEHRRAEYEAVDAEEFTVSATCPTCGQPLPKDKIDAARAKFNTDKAARLEKLMEGGRQAAERVQNIEVEVGFRKDGLDKAKSEAKEQREKIEKLKKQLADSEEVKPRALNPEEVVGYHEAMKEVAAIEKRMEEVSNRTSDEQSEEINARLAELHRHNEELLYILHQLGEAKKCNERIEELREEGKKIAQQIATYEKKVFVTEELQRAKIKELEQNVNKMFSKVQWRLFDYTIDGNPIETCVAIVGNAPYPVANHADQVNAGLDIIRTLSKFHDTKCPIFIDNAESIVNIDAYDKQLIALYVEAGSELKVKSKE